MAHMAHLKPLAWACPQAAGRPTLVQEPGELTQFRVWDPTAELQQTSSVKILNYQRLEYFLTKTTANFYTGFTACQTLL